MKDAAIEITTLIGCRVSCVYCPQKILAREYRKHSNILELNLEDFKTCLNKIPEHVHIIFGGMSEAFLNPGCTQMILYATKKKRKVGITTTLVGMKLSDLEPIKNAGLEFLYLHLPAAEGLESIKITDEYLSILEDISKSKTETCYIAHSDKLHPRISHYLKNKKLIIPPTITRSGNIEIGNKPLPKKATGPIDCKRNCRWNVLLPNADVLLCSNDYGMKHILGNLLTSDYASLFRGTEYLKVKRGLRVPSIESLCRKCDTFSYPVNIFTKVFSPIKKILRYVRSSLNAAITGKSVFYP